MITVKKTKGFSLVEVVVTVAIIAILGAIAVPMYNRYRVEARRSEAFHFLPAIHGTQQQHFLEEGTYTCDVDHLMIDNPTDTNQTTYYKYHLCNVVATFLGDGLKHRNRACAGGAISGEPCRFWGEINAANLRLGYVAIATGDLDDDIVYDNVAIGNMGLICPPDTCRTITAAHTSVPIVNGVILNDDVNENSY